MSTCCHSSKSSGQEHTLSCSNPSDKQTGIVWGSSLYGPVQKRNLSGRSFCSLEVCTYPGLESESKSPAHAAEERVGVLLLNLGGPDTLNDVQPFLFNLFADPVCLPNSFCSLSFCWQEVNAFSRTCLGAALTSAIPWNRILFVYQGYSGSSNAHWHN